MNDRHALTCSHLLCWWCLIDKLLEPLIVGLDQVDMIDQVLESEVRSVKRGD